MRLLPALSLLTLLTLTAGECNVYGDIHEETIDRCRQVQACVSEAFYSNQNNLYIRDKVFLSTESRPPVELIIEYNVTMDTTGTDEDKANNSFGSGSATDELNLDRNDQNETSDEQHVVLYEIGWSISGVYKGIRPVILLSFQPAWYRWTLTFAIKDYGFTRKVQFKLNLTDTSMCQQIENLAESEVKEALDHLSMKVCWYKPVKVI